MSFDVNSILRVMQDEQVRLARLWFTDVLGGLKSIAISPAELEQAFSDGVRFDGSVIDGFARVQESDVLAMPDATTFELLPHRPDEPVSARLFCSICKLDRTPFPGGPRWVLQQSLEKARELGYEFYCSPEVEFFYFKEQNGTGNQLVATPGGTMSGMAPQPLDYASYFDHSTDDTSGRLRQRTLQVLEEMGIPVEYSFHEEGPGQNEIDLRYTDALTMADQIITLRYVVKRVAREEGVMASFMPKPLSGAQGSGMHTHLSLFEGDKNAFYGRDSETGLSKVGQAFIAGLLRHAPEITAVTNQLVNSYKRFAKGDEAPSYVAWARNNRSALVRVPLVNQNKPDSTRIEYRALDTAANPYLAFAVMLAAGLAGIAGEYELPEEADVNLSGLDFMQARKHDLRPLPLSLNEALLEMEGSELVGDVLGEHIFEWFLRNKRAEWTQYQQQITELELQRYLDW